MQAQGNLPHDMSNSMVCGLAKGKDGKERVMIRYDHYTDKFVKVSDRECPWCKAVCASTDKYCHECGWHIADTPQTESYYTDTTHFGKAKGESTTTNTADTPQTDRMTEEEIDTMLAKALVGQTDCSWMRYEE